MPNTPDPERNSKKNKLAKAYIHALVAKLNYICQEANSDVDGAGIDFIIFNRGVGTSRTIGSESNQVNIQLKAVSVSSTSMFRETNEHIEYKLVDPLEPIGPNFYLVVVQLLKEEDIDNWIEHTSENLILKKCAYYIQLKNTLNAGFVRIPKANLLSPTSLPGLFIPATNKEELI